MYLDDITYFTREHFKDGIWWGNFDFYKFSKLIEAGWIEKFYIGKGRGDHSKYKLTMKARRMVTMTYKYCYQEEYLPETVIKGNTYQEKKLQRFIIKHNQQLKHEQRKKFTSR